jgi:hypothetical protein
LRSVVESAPARAIPSRFVNRGKEEASAEDKQAKIDGRNKRCVCTGVWACVYVCRFMYVYVCVYVCAERRGQTSEG